MIIILAYLRLQAQGISMQLGKFGGGKACYNRIQFQQALQEFFMLMRPH